MFNSGSGFGDGHSTAVGDTTLCLVGLMLISSLRRVYYNCEMGNVSSETAITKFSSECGSLPRVLASEEETLEATVID